jgi:hypothetical protein
MKRQEFGNALMLTLSLVREREDKGLSCAMGMLGDGAWSRSWVGLKKDRAWSCLMVGLWKDNPSSRSIVGLWPGHQTSATTHILSPGPIPSPFILRERAGVRVSESTRSFTNCLARNGNHALPTFSPKIKGEPVRRRAAA